MKQIYVVEDDPKIRANLRFLLRENDFEVQVMARAEEALSALDEAVPDLVLLDVRLPEMSGLDLVRRLVDESRLPPTIIISGEASISETVDALRLGVLDFVEKPFSVERLLQSIRTTLENSELRREVASLRARLEDGTGEPRILGGSAAMRELLDRIEKAAVTEARILIRGESGTGKELVADALHRASSRRDGPFIKINCAAIPAHLIEDELFGHVKGAFTDARQAKPGLFEEAHGGTLFLDEIGDMDVALQARLLRVLEDGKVRRIGDTRDREVDVRVVAATHADLEDSVAEGGFREDLYFRLAHLPLVVPPLRSRGDDIQLLFHHYLEHFCKLHRCRPKRVGGDVLRLLADYPWPGNVRELRNLCERLVVFGGDPITPDQLPSAIAQGRISAPETGLVRLEDRPTLELKEFRRRCETEYIESILQRTRWNVAAAARVLGLRRSYLHEKMNQLGLSRPEPEID
ncbi:MAG: sigma-54 dependent transcriptional regulator [Thermoanaerobaculia bacterium]|nr:sigma-54 dependent transcriptional regulator [Thermoanaerobaculia bacterium]